MRPRPGKGNFEAESKARRKAGLPAWRVVSASADEVQGVVAADLDGDGDLDVASASSGDHSIAWFENMGGGRFCEVKRVVDDDAIGARTVAAGDLDGDGKVDLASASKDDDTIAVYLQGEAFSKRVVNASAAGAYSLVVVDVDRDGDADLVTASNGDDTVAWYENDGTGTAWTFHEIYAGADFVLSVAAADFDLDGDVDRPSRREPRPMVLAVPCPSRGRYPHPNASRTAGLQPPGSPSAGPAQRTLPASQRFKNRRTLQPPGSPGQAGSPAPR